MKTLFILLAVFSATLNAAAQTTIWVEQGSGPQNTYGNAIAKDNDANLYITGKFRDTVNFGTTQLTENNLGTPYAAKYDSSGNLLWAFKEMGGTGIAFDGSSALYLYNEGKSVQKIDLDGGVIWDKDMFNTSIFGSSGIMGMHATTSEIYLTGYLSGDGYFGSDTTINEGGWDIFIAKFDTAGVNIWARSAGGTELDKGYGVFLSASNEVYATGYYADTAHFETTELISNGSKDIYLAKYTAGGQFLWVKSFGGANFDLAAVIEEDETGDLYLTGRYEDTITFGADVLSGTNIDAFITKFDTAGNPLWAQAIIGLGDDEEADINYADGKLTFICTTEGDVIADAFTPIGLGNLDIAIGEIDSAGNMLWIKLYGGSSNDEGAGLTRIGDDLYFNGSFNSIGTFDSFQLTSVSSWDVVTGKISLSAPSGIQHSALSLKGIQVYPNPAIGHITISSEQFLLKGNVRVINLSGQTMIECNRIEGREFSIDLTGFPSGIYFIEVMEEGNVSRTKIIKQ